MNETRTLCDVKTCKNIAKPFYFFKKRKADGAGSMENWNYKFDLCVDHQACLLNALLKHLEKDNQDILLKLTNIMGVNMQSE